MKTVEASERPAAVPITMPSTSPIAQPVRQWIVALRAMRESSRLSDEASECMHQLLRHLVAARGVVAHRHAVLHMAGRQAERDLVERGVHRRDLLEDVGAPAVLLPHRLEAARLPFDAAQPLEEGVLLRAVAACVFLGFRGHASHTTGEYTVTV